MGIIHDSVSVDLVGVGGPCVQNVTGFLGFRDAHRGGGFPCAIIQIKQEDIVPTGGEAGDRAATAVLGISRMAARDYGLVLSRRYR